MLTLKQQGQKKNDPMSILNQLKKLKSKGKTRTPRPTLEVKSSRVESSTAVLIRKDVQSINSLSREKQKQKDREREQVMMKRVNIQSQKHIHASQERRTIVKNKTDQSLEINLNQNVNLKNYKEPLGLEYRFRPIIDIFDKSILNHYDKSSKNNRNSVSGFELDRVFIQVQHTMKSFDERQLKQKQDNTFDHFDFWMGELLRKIQRLIGDIFNVFIAESEQRIALIDQIITSMQREYEAKINQLNTKQKCHTKTFIQRLNQLTSKNLFANEVIVKLSRDVINIEQYVKRNIYVSDCSSTQNSCKADQVKRSSLLKSQESFSDGLSSRTEVKNLHVNNMHKKNVQHMYVQNVDMKEGHSNLANHQDKLPKKLQININGNIPTDAARKQLSRNPQEIYDKNSQFTIKSVAHKQQTQTYSMIRTAEKKQNNLQDYNVVVKHKYHRSEHQKHQMIHIQENHMNESEEMEESWDRYY